MRKRVSLQRLVTLSVLSLGLLTGTIGLAYAYWQAKHSLRATIGLTFQELARQSADKAGLILDKEVEWVERLASTPEVVDAVRSGTGLAFNRPAFQRWREHQLRYFRSIVVVDRHGNSVGGVTSDAMRTHYLQQRWWPIVVGRQQPWVGELYSEDTGSRYLEVTVPLTDQGTVIGAIKVVMEKDQLFASVVRNPIGESGHVMLLNQQGMVLVCPLLAPADHKEIRSGGGTLFDSGHQVNEAAWFEVEEDSHGEAGGIVGIAPVTIRSNVVQDDQWYALVRQDPDETYASLTVLMRRLGAFGVLAVGIVAFLRWRLARRIVRPIHALMVRMKQFGQAVPPRAPAAFQPVGIVELDELAASFDDLALRLAHAAQERERQVAELERTNRELVKSEEHYRRVWNHSLHIRLLVDADGIIRDINRRGEIKLWRPASKLIGTSVLSLFLEQDWSRLRRLLTDAFTTGREQAAGELSVPGPAGDDFTMEADLVPLEKGRAVEGVMVQLTDLTERKQLQEQLLRSERLASLSQFASMFAHDIRNPLVGIKKTLELLSDRRDVGADMFRRSNEDMRFTIELLLGMINDMLDVYQESYSGLPLLLSTVSLKTLANDVIHLFRAEAESRRIRFRLDLASDDVVVRADGRRLLRVLINLIHNALKFSPSGGTIAITIRDDASAPPGYRSAEQGVPTVMLLVEDEGPGIAAEDLPHVFDLFFRRKDAGDIRAGRGLGLHFSRLVMEAHGGRISAENRPDGGAVLSLVLPVKQEAYAGHSADR